MREGRAKVAKKGRIAYERGSDWVEAVWRHRIDRALPNGCFAATIPVAVDRIGIPHLSTTSAGGCDPSLSAPFHLYLISWPVPPYNHPAHDSDELGYTMATPYTHPNSTYGSTVYPPSVGDTWRDVDREAAGKDRGIMRTPSPTPEEAEELSRTGIIDWRGMSRPGYWLRKEWISAS
jgi:hypothetical protein